VSLAQLQVGDHVVIRNRELIPADAKLISGPALIDYSFVTGESEPVAKVEGDYLFAGGQQIGGAIEMEIMKPVSQSYLTSLWGHEAFRKKRDHSLNSLTNQYSRRFTLIVIGVALAAAVFWAANGNVARGIKAFTSVLIVACPCALALAAPFTLGTAQRWLARSKIFLKNTLVIERLAQVNAIVFDKTGTLTSAGTKAVSFRGPPLSDEEKRWIVSLARQSAHPLSMRIGAALAAQATPETVASFVETTGCGVEGRVAGRAIWMGSRAWLEMRGTKCSRRVNAEDSNSNTTPPHYLADHESSVVHMAIDGAHRGAFVMSSALRPETEELVHSLGSRYELALLSGDNEHERERFRRLFGENANLHFNQSPLDKLGFIRRLQESGGTVMMVGDGLNDAGALQQSDVGVAVVENVGAFSPASDVILEAQQVARLGEILTVARRCVRIVRAGFVLSGLYNVVGVSIAAAGILSPMVCAVLMPLSSASVVLFACGAATWAARKVARVSEPAVSPPSTSASQTNRPSRVTGAAPAGLVTRDTADLAVRATWQAL
jgi:Cu+-exporting ATPase